MSDDVSLTLEMNNLMGATLRDFLSLWLQSYKNLVGHLVDTFCIIESFLYFQLCYLTVNYFPDIVQVGRQHFLEVLLRRRRKGLRF